MPDKYVTYVPKFVMPMELNVKSMPRIMITVVSVQKHAAA
jgi:hypothetical protein